MPGPAADPVESLTDPDALRDHDGITVEDRTDTIPEPQFEGMADGAGMAIVGVRNGDGEVLLVAREEDDWMLPFGPVDDGEDWAAAATRWAELLSGVEARLTAVRRVRAVEAVEESTGERTTVHEVVYAATTDDPTIAEDPGPHEDDDWTAAWFGEIDDQRVHGDGGDAGDDVDLFLG